MKAKLNRLADLANRHYAKLGTLLVVGSPLLSHAAEGDISVTAVVAAIAAAVILVGLIGNAKLLVAVAIKTFAWVRQSMS